MGQQRLPLSHILKGPCCTENSMSVCKWGEVMLLSMVGGGTCGVSLPSVSKLYMRAKGQPFLCPCLYHGELRMRAREQSFPCFCLWVEAQEDTACKETTSCQAPEEHKRSQVSHHSNSQHHCFHRSCILHSIQWLRAIAGNCSLLSPVSTVTFQKFTLGLPLFSIIEPLCWSSAANFFQLTLLTSHAHDV